MPVPTDITAGTISISGTSVTGVGTAFATSDIREGDIFIWIEGGQGRQPPIVATVNSETSITLAEAWTGAALTGARYRLRYQWDSSRQSAQNRQLIDLLGNGKLSSLGSLTGGANTLPYFIGPNAFAQTALTPFARSLLDDANVTDFWSTIGQVPNAQIRNDLTPDKAFRRGNVLGTVEQSAGVPTGALIEVGTNANGTYARFADGTQFMWSSVVSVSLATTAQQSFPAPASSVSTQAFNMCVVAPEVLGGGSFSNTALQWLPMGATSFSSNFNFRFSSAYSGSLPGGTASAKFFSVSRWF